MEIYVETMPKSCSECPCCNNDIDYGAYCNLDAFEYREYHQTIYKHPKCPLKPLSDRLAEERKKVCDQLKDYITRHYLASIKGNGDVFLELNLTDLNTIFEIIEDGKYENFIPN